MQAAVLWRKLFSEEHLREQYENKVKLHPSIGMDKITLKKFAGELDENIEIILRKTKNDTYHFTRYKLLLFTKGPNKCPRPICVPTMRDKLTLSVLNEILVQVFFDVARTPMPQPIIQKILEQCSRYDSYIKLDIDNFYPSIDRANLYKKIRRHIRKKEILHLIERAVETEAIQYPVVKKTPTIKKTPATEEKGIPEGLSISNALANIYMMDLDKKYGEREDILYCRYVDDILVLLHQKDQAKIQAELERDMGELHLSINSGKKANGHIANGVEYLGYQINDEKVTVRKSSVLKIEQSIEDLFRDVRRVNRSGIDTTKYIEWKLNLKITGFILENKKYGWLFFYSQMNDLTLLFHLDDVVKKLIRRYGLSGKIKVKRFVKTYFEITRALHATTYIPNIDQYSMEEKRKCVGLVYGIDAENQSDDDIEWEFRKLMRQEIRNIERDVQSFS